MKGGFFMLKEREIIRLLHQGISQRSICKMIKTSDRKIRQTINDYSAQVDQSFRLC